MLMDVEKALEKALDFRFELMLLTACNFRNASFEKEDKSLYILFE